MLKNINNKSREKKQISIFRVVSANLSFSCSLYSFCAIITKRETPMFKIILTIMIVEKKSAFKSPSDQNKHNFHIFKFSYF